MTFLPTLTSVSNPRVKAVAKLRDAPERRRTGLFLVEGDGDVRRAIDFGYRPLDVFTTEPADGATHVSPAVMAKMSYRKTPEDVLAVFKAQANSLADLPTPTASDLYLVCVGTEKPGNLGAMARTAAAVGCRGMIATGRVDLENPNAIRNSRAAVLAPWCVAAEEDETRTWLRRHGVRVLSTAVAEPGATDLWRVADDAAPTAVVIGPEHAGLDRAWLEPPHVPITIPMHAGDAVDSLNASVTAAIVLFEMDRRRRPT